MLPSISMNSQAQGNGVLNSRDALRHTAGAKRYKYLRRLFRFRQMDFEFAAWQMLYLFTSPQRVYRNFHYRKQTKDQWARDDPAFLVLLSVWLCVSTIGFGFVLDMGFFETIKLLLWVVFIDCVGVGLLISTLMWFISNKYLVKRRSRDYDVEWGYAFDVHLNAFYPLLVILHFIQLFFINHVILTDTFIGYFIGNTLWLIAIGYYIYVTFLGYSVTSYRPADPCFSNEETKAWRDEVTCPGHTARAQLRCGEFCRSTQPRQSVPGHLQATRRSPPFSPVLSGSGSVVAACSEEWVGSDVWVCGHISLFKTFENHPFALFPVFMTVVWFFG